VADHTVYSSETMNQITSPGHHGVLVVLTSLLLFACGCEVNSGIYNVRQFGAIGDGKTIDTPAINRAIEVASHHGGGTVRIPPGTYLCYSIRLHSHITLHLDSGAVILAAGDPDKGTDEHYDPPEPNVFDPYEDFGHSHWHNSLIWGEGLHDVTIEGPGLIYGKGLSHGQLPKSSATTKPAKKSSTRPTTRGSNEENGTGSGKRRRRRRKAPATLPSPYNLDDRAWPPAPSTEPTSQPTTKPMWDFGYPNDKDTLPAGIGNKTIALKYCYNVNLRDISIRQGGHFAILATGVDNLTINNVKLDTNRDGMDIDCCKNVRVSDCTINSPSDDGLCLKSSYALGVNRPCEDVTITNCLVTGAYQVGTVLDGTFKKFDLEKHSGRTGRIKFGTESNGGFKNISISNCVFDNCNGLALESVDGGDIENITIDNIAMRDITNSPIFIRIGSRLRGPFEAVGHVRHIWINNIVATNSASRFACVISGIPGHDIEDLHISNVRLIFPGDHYDQDATTQPAEDEKDYPEPTMFRATPSYGFYIRHVTGLEMDNISLTTMSSDVRPPFALEYVNDADFDHIRADHDPDVSTFKLDDVSDFTLHRVRGVPDTQADQVDDQEY
jgi:polygalacturonase